MLQYFTPTEIGELGVRRPKYTPDQDVQFRRYGRMGCVIGVEHEWDDPPEEVTLVDEGATVAEVEDEQNVEIEEYECDVCGETFDTHQGLAGHSRAH